MQQARAGHHPRVRGEHAGHVGENVALMQTQRRCQGDRRRIGAAATQRGDVPVRRYSLKAGDHDDRIPL